MSDDAMIPGAPEVEEYAEGMRLAGVNHADLIKDTTQQGVSVVLNTGARDTANISADAIEKARREVVKATNAIQSRFVLGIVPSVRQGDDAA